MLAGRATRLFVSMPARSIGGRGGSVGAVRTATDRLPGRIVALVAGRKKDSVSVSASSQTAVCGRSRSSRLLQRGAVAAMRPSIDSARSSHPGVGIVCAPKVDGSAVAGGTVRLVGSESRELSDSASESAQASSLAVQPLMPRRRRFASSRLLLKCAFTRSTSASALNICSQTATVKRFLGNGLHNHG